MLTLTHIYIIAITLFVANIASMIQMKIQGNKDGLKDSKYQVTHGSTSL
jgi:hypothetical protein